jgi:hypothetical protein
MITLARRHRIAILLGLLVGGTSVWGILAQGAPAQGAMDGDPVPYVREVWNYPSTGLPDPMDPPASLREATGLPKLVLTGILLNTQDAKLHLAMLRIAGREDQRFTVQVGDSVPPYRILEIQKDRVRVEYPQLGGIRSDWLIAPTGPTGP